MAVRKNTRWCLNVDTKVVKPWNDNMIFVDNLVECTKNGIPLSAIEVARSVDVNSVGFDATVDTVNNDVDDSVDNVVDDATNDVDNDADDDTDDDIDDDIDDDPYKEKRENLMALLKSNLVDMARSKGIPIDNKDALRMNKNQLVTLIIERDEEHGG